MPDVIHTKGRGTRDGRTHIAVQFYTAGTNGLALTKCGRKVNGDTGFAAPAIVNCQNCRRIAGYK